MPPRRSRPEGAPSRSGREVLPARTREARRAACNELTDATQRQLYDQIERATQRGSYPNHRNAERRCDGPASQQYEHPNRIRNATPRSRHQNGPACSCENLILHLECLGTGTPITVTACNITALFVIKIRT